MQKIWINSNELLNFKFLTFKKCIIYDIKYAYSRNNK